MKTLIILVAVVCIATITSCKKSTEEKSSIELFANEIDCDQVFVGYDEISIHKDYSGWDLPLLVSTNRQKTKSRIDICMDSIVGYGMRIYGYDTVILHKPECTKYKISMDPKGKSHGKAKIFIGRFWMLKNSIVDLGYNRFYQWKFWSWYLVNMYSTYILLIFRDGVSVPFFYIFAWI